MSKRVVTEKIQNDEPLNIYCWRLKCFSEMGFKPSDCDRLAESHVDIRQVEKMINDGCERKLILKIVL